MTTRPRLPLLLGGAAVALAVLGGCSGGPDGGSAGSVSAEDVPGPAAARAVSGADRGAVAPADVGRAVVRTRSVVRTGELSLTGTDLGAVRRKVDRLLRAVGGTVDKDVSTNDRRGRVVSSRLVLRVPVARFDAFRDALSGLGRQTSSSVTEKDVTTQVIDTAERVQTLQNSLDRLQRFQRTAGDVRDLLRFEDQITTRQSELQSLKAQQTYLADQTSMSTLTVHLSTPDTTVTPGALDDAGFLSGLRGGWHALVGVVVVALTVLGAALPFLVVLAALGVPAWLLLRVRASARARSAG